LGYSLLSLCRSLLLSARQVFCFALSFGERRGVCPLPISPSTLGLFANIPNAANARKIRLFAACETVKFTHAVKLLFFTSF